MVSVLFLAKYLSADLALITVIAKSKREAMTQMELQLGAQWHDPQGARYMEVVSVTVVEPGVVNVAPVKFPQGACCAG